MTRWQKPGGTWPPAMNWRFVINLHRTKNALPIAPF
jgi:hypothetical protein